MPRVRPLTPEQARSTFANRFSRLTDRTRQFATKFGVRPNRVFLRWTKWSGTERGEGQEQTVLTFEILPTPRVTSLDMLTFSLAHAGVIPVGSVRIDRISVALFTSDILLGKAWPNAHSKPGEERKTLMPIVAPMPGMHRSEPHIPEPYEFFWEIVEDGRGDDPAKRHKFRPMSAPFRRAGKVDWTIMLERVSLDRTRQDKSAIGEGVE